MSGVTASYRTRQLGHEARRARWIGPAPHDLVRQAGSKNVAGTVVGVFSTGCYVRCGDVVVAIGSISAGPLHLVIVGPRLRVVEGDAVDVGPIVLRLGNETVDLGGASLWAPEPPASDCVASLGASMASVDAAVLVADELGGVWNEVRCAARRGDANDLSRLLAGRGSGLTPTGDDVIAGLLLADAWSRSGPEADARRIGHAASIPTTDLSSSFLRWAAEGQSIEPVHRLLDHAECGRARCFVADLGVVAGIGGSSGRALIAGLALGLEHDVTY